MKGWRPHAAFGSAGCRHYFDDCHLLFPPLEFAAASRFWRRECLWLLPAYLSSPLSRSFGGVIAQSLSSQWRPSRVLTGSAAFSSCTISLAQKLRAASRPHYVALLVLFRTRRFSDRERNPGNESIPGILIFVKSCPGSSFQHRSCVRDEDSWPHSRPSSFAPD